PPFGGSNFHQALAVLNGEEVVSWYVLDGFHLAGGPVDLDQVDACPSRQAEVQAQITRGEIAAAAPNLVPLNQIAGHHLHACPQRIGIFPHANHLDCDPVVVVAAVVAQDGGLAVEIIDDDVDVAVVEEIAEGGAAADAGHHE